MSNSNGFSENADLYASSPAHLDTGDLALALDLLGDLEGRDLLDVGTGTGHAAFFFAQKLAQVFGVDIQDEMLAVAQEEADKRSLTCRFLNGLASDLPFDDAVFDIVTSRLATHHFEAPGDFLAETRRVLRPGGQILVVDNVVPEHDPETGDWINDFEKERDSSHETCLSVSAWRALLNGHGFAEPVVKDFCKSLDYDLWMKRKSVADSDADRLWARLIGAPDPVVRFLKPSDKKGRSLTLHRMVAVAKKR